MNYPVVIHKDDDSDYGVTVPDLPGCFSAGDSFEDALENAKEAILCHIEGMLADGEKLQQPLSIESHQGKKEFKGGVWALVSVDLSEVSGKSKRVNISVPERILTQFDSFAEKKGESRSGFLVAAALEYISKHPEC
jgi:predicted RNase H-like HicB family nuclease